VKQIFTLYQNLKVRPNLNLASFIRRWRSLKLPNVSYDVIVIGAGAAGLMAAGQAAQKGANTLLLEKMERPGRKLFISGKGRCNLTNIAPINEFLEHFGKNGHFLRQAFHRFFTQDLVIFFEEQGVPTITERGGRVFPASESSQDVIDALTHWANYSGVELRLNSPAKNVKIKDGKITGVEAADRFLAADAVIIATGGASYPATGSTGDGYQFGEAAGHTIIPIRPALVPLATAGKTAQQCQGLSLRNVHITVWTDNKQTDAGFGEMLFTHFGISGPVILTLSGKIVDSLLENKLVQVNIDLKPALDDQKLDARIRRDLDSNGKKQFQTILNGLLPKKLIPICIDQTGIPAAKVCHQITSQERKQLCHWLKNFRLHVTGHRSFKQAIITAGGVDTREINPRTMESIIVNGLFFAGEVVDVDADTGGYNLQAAFSTGWLAGQSAAEYSNKS
jgi:predicted Rossmann fold flavoprotein